MNAKLIEYLTILKDNSDGYRSRAFELSIITIRDLNYEISADTISRLKGQIKAKQIKGIGTGIMARIEEFTLTGAIVEADVISDETRSIDELIKIKGVGKKTARIWYQRGIKSLVDIKRAVSRGDIEPTIAQKYGILYYYDLNEKIPRDEITEYTNWMRNHIRSDTFDVVGSYRRGAQSSGDVDILISIKSVGAIKTMLAIQSAIMSEYFICIIAEGELSLTYLYNFAGKVRQCDILITDKVGYPSALLYFTGSREHSIMLRKRAKAMNYTLNQYGLFKGDKRLRAKSEKEIYEKLGLKFIEPNLR